MSKKNSRFLLLAILLFAFVTRVWRLHLPTTYVFDEVYHVITSRLIANNDPRAFEWWHQPLEPDTAIDWLHPPLAKYTQAVAINILGNNSFAWRISSALFGVGVIWLVYQLSQKLFGDERLSLLAAGLTSLDGLLLVQSRIMMNDVHVTFFILLSAWMFIRYQRSEHWRDLILTSLASGLAISTKWSGVLLIITLALVAGFIELRRLWIKQLKLKSFLIKILLYFLTLIVIPASVYLLSYSQMWLQGKDWQHFVQLHQQIWHYQTTLQATHHYQSRPLEWFLNLKPVWFYVDYTSDTHRADIYAQSNPIMSWLAAVSTIWTLIFIVWQNFKKRANKNTQKLTLLIACYLGVWLPWQLSPRILFYYHYLPGIPFLMIILAYWLKQIWQQPAATSINWHQVLVWSVILLSLGNFVIWYPHWTAIPVKKEIIENIYWALPSWQ